MPIKDNESKIKAEMVKKIEKEVGSKWLQLVSEYELDQFIEWAAPGQVLFYPGNERLLQQAFSGYLIGLTVSKGDPMPWNR